MQIIIVGDELHCGVPDVFCRELAGSLNQGDHDISVPLQVWEEPTASHEHVGNKGAVQHRIQYLHVPHLHIELSTAAYWQY